MNIKLILTAITLATLSSTSFAKEIYSKSDHEEYGYGSTRGVKRLSAQLLPIGPGQIGSGEFYFANHTNRAPHKETTTFHGGITLPLGTPGYNEDSIAKIQNLGVTLTNGSGTLSCTLTPERIRFSQHPKNTVALVEVDFNLGERTSKGRKPVYSAGSCAALPPLFVSGDTLTITVISGNTLITALSGRIR